MTRFFMLILVCTNFIQMAMLILLAQFVGQNMVFDIDNVRAAYVKSLRYNYHEACRMGVDQYPSEYRTELVIGFNVHNSMNWCEEQVKMKEGTFLEEAIKNVR